jgi:cytochrome b pre-mRNA-processing protein 3
MRLPFLKSKPLADPAALYAAVVNAARLPDWYRDAQVPDTMDGRFAVLTSLLALADIRLERGGGAARALGPRLTEAYIADMDAQMRQAGFGDPSLGKQVRMMVGALASKVDRWRLAVASVEPWAEVARGSLYRDSPVTDAVANVGIAATKAWWERLQRAGDGDILAGRIG